MAIPGSTDWGDGTEHPCEDRSRPPLVQVDARGTAGPAQLRRTLPIALAAKKSGPIGFEFYVVSCDPRLIDKTLRQDAERFMFSWVSGRSEYVNWNRQVSWR